MKRTFMGLMAAFAVTLLPATQVLAEEIQFASHAEIMSVLERQNTRIAELESALHNGGGCSSCGSGDSCGGSCCDSCCDSCCCDPCCRPSGIIANAEWLFLKPHFSLGSGAGDDFDWNYESAPRITVGYQGSDGLGFRIRYFEFDHGQSDIGVGAVDDAQAIDTYLFDLEFVDSMSLGCYWDATFSAGFRYEEFAHERVIYLTGTTTPIAGQVFANSAIGMTVSAELRRCIGNGLAGFINTRASVLMGDEKEWNVLAPGAYTLTDTELDNIYYIYEAQAGVQWTNELQDGGYLFARAAFEVQIWDNFAGSGVVDNATEDFGLGGAVFSAGIIR
jgi:hypothetical protein